MDGQVASAALTVANASPKDSPAAAANRVCSPVVLPLTGTTSDRTALPPAAGTTA